MKVMRIFKHFRGYRHTFAQTALALAAVLTINACIYLHAGLYVMIAATAIAAVILIFKDYTRGLAWMVFLIPLDSITDIIPGFTVTKMIGIVTFIAFLISKGKQGIKLPDPSLIVFFVYISMSAFWAVDSGEALDRILNLANYFAFLTMMVNVKIDGKNLRKYLNPYIYGCVIISGLGIYNFLASGGTQRVAAFNGENMNFYGLTLGIGILTGLYLYKNSGTLSSAHIRVYRSSWNNLYKNTDASDPELEPKLDRNFRKVYLPACFVFVLGQTVSLSRTAWAATCVGIFVYFAGSRFSLKRVFRAAAALFSILAFPLLLLKSIVPGAADLLFERFLSIFTLSDRAAGRLDIWKVAWSIFKDHPLTGVGISNFPAAFTYGYLINSSASMNTRLHADPHNLYISVLVELGILGMILFAAVLIKVYKNVLSIHRTEHRELCLTLFFFIATAGLASTILYKKYFWYVLSLIYLFSSLHPADEKREDGSEHERIMQEEHYRKEEGQDRPEE